MAAYYYGTRALAGAAMMAASVKMARSEHSVPAPAPPSQQTIPGSVELHCSPLSPSCSTVTAFFRKLKVDCKVVDISPLKGYEIKKADKMHLSSCSCWHVAGRSGLADVPLSQSWTVTR